MLSSKVYNVDCSARAQDGCNRLVARKRSVIVHGRFGGREGRFYGRRPKDKSTIFVFISSYVLTAFAWRFEEINERLPLAPSFTTVLSIRWSPSLVISETYTNGMPRNWMSPSPCVYSAVSRRAHQMARFAAVFRFVFFFFYYEMVVIVCFPRVVRVHTSNAADKPTKDAFFFFFLKREKMFESRLCDVRFPNRPFCTVTKQPRGKRQQKRSVDTWFRNTDATKFFKKTRRVYDCPTATATEASRTTFSPTSFLGSKCTGCFLFDLTWSLAHRVLRTRVFVAVDTRRNALWIGNKLFEIFFFFFYQFRLIFKVT